jgi:hypothetical protein
LVKHPPAKGISGQWNTWWRRRDELEQQLCFRAKARSLVAVETVCHIERTIVAEHLWTWFREERHCWRSARQHASFARIQACAANSGTYFEDLFDMTCASNSNRATCTKRILDWSGARRTYSQPKSIMAI